MCKDTCEMVQACIHCVIAYTRDRISRPLATALHGEKPNEIFHMDFLNMGKYNKGDMKYVLVIMDDLSSYNWLYSCDRADSDSATNALDT